MPSKASGSKPSAKKPSGSKPSAKKSSGSKSSGKKTPTMSVEDRYKKLKDQHASVLKRPTIYIGSTKEQTDKMWVVNENRKDDDPEFINKKISYVPGLFKIFDEILVNASDHVVRCITDNLPEKCTMIKVNINEETGQLSVWNNGSGIPVVMHNVEKMYVPSLLFGEMLTSENYDDDKDRIVGGQNGLGAKLTNIMSVEFEVETVDVESGKKLYQKFGDNMYTKGDAKVTSSSMKKSYTKISFIPDYKRFGLENITPDIVSLFKKRVYDVAMIRSGIKVYYNDELVVANDITKYINLYFAPGAEFKKVLDVTSNEFWRVAVVYDASDKLDHCVVSFVNSINTYAGGTHVSHVVDKITNAIKKKVTSSAKGKALVLKPNMIKENLIFFVDCCLVRPEFNNQSKECLTTKISDFSTKYDPPEAFINKILKTGVVDSILANANSKAEANLAKGTGGKTLSPKLYDAHHAKKKDGTCTLILTEGDSAKTVAMRGTNVIGRDKYGVFPLKGKLLNVREATLKQLSENEEIQEIMKIVGLEHKKKYKTTEGLRYGSILILTDQDRDGSHIKGLIMNFIHFFWPSLMRAEGFVQCLATPLVKLTKKGKKKSDTISCYSEQEYEEWKSNNDSSKWNAKYYKGLGTLDPKESIECFTDYADKVVSYFWQKKIEDEQEETDYPVYVPKGNDVTDDAITLAFAKKREDDRKQWLTTYNPNAYVDNREKRISFYEFVHKELIAFSVSDTKRSIPNIMDGFKPGQRKVMYAGQMKGLDKPSASIKVAQFGGYISENTQYHHGEKSLEDTIVGQAQNFVGSNNINLFKPQGQFGSRMQGGKDHASARYVFTALEPLTKRIFIDDDKHILQAQTEDNVPIEPVYFAPIVPMVLINGTEGIGTGYSTLIRPVNPRDVFNNLYRFLDGKKMKPMHPWYRNFSGSIEKIDKYNYKCRARYEIHGDTVIIHDLPVGVWTDYYKDYLHKLVNGAKEEPKKEPASPVKKKSKKVSTKKFAVKVAKTNTIGQDIIKPYAEDCTDVRVHFTIKFKSGKLEKYINDETLESKLKLVVPIKLSNMHLFDHNGQIKKYSSYVRIMEEYAAVRLDLYQKRKDFLLGKWNNDLDILKWKLKFVEGVIDDKIHVLKRKKADIEQQLEKMKFPKLSNKGEDEDDKSSYGYLTSMAIIKFSQEEVDRLREAFKNKEQEIRNLESQEPNDMWRSELDLLVQDYDKWDSRVTAEYLSDFKKIAKKKPNKK